MLLIDFLPVIAVCFGTWLLSRRLFHYFQLESYQFRGFFKTIDRQADKAILPGLIFGTVTFLLLLPASAVFSGLHTTLAYILSSAALSILIAGTAYIIYRKLRKSKEKKPFRITSRIKRLYFWLAVILSAVGIIIKLIFVPDLINAGIKITVLSLIPLFLPLWATLAGLLAIPLEKLIYEMYFRDAQKKLLSNDRLIRIGITGSFGKTSTKFILSEMLSQKYNVLATPTSYNTPMGLTSIIRSRLTPAHQVFIAEMGARHPKDITELCRLVHPAIGILTSIGPQHLDTFKTLETIKNTKYDLIRSLPPDGLSVFANDDGIVRELYDITEKPKLLAGKEDSDAWATDISVDGHGSSFVLHLRGQNPVPCTTPLLGKHNIANIVLSAALACKLGVAPRQIQTAVSQLKPVEHRMKIVSNAGGITVIDDAFNTNPVSSKAALDVLKMFPQKRIIVTPGMVELGADETKFNHEFGEYMADCVDIAFLIGRKHTEPIREGLLSKGFDEGSIFSFNHLDDAVAALKGIAVSGDTVMYENDLPDSYSEGE